MLKVIIEIHPFGREENKRTIKEIYIGNMGRVADSAHCTELCEYHIWVEKNPKATLKPPKPDAITVHDRADGALMLVADSILTLLKCDYTITPQKPEPPRAA